MLRLRLGHDPRGGKSDQFFAGITEHLADAPVGIEVNSPGIGDDDAVRRTFEQRAVARLARPPRLLCPLTDGLVGPVARQMQRLVEHADDHARQDDEK